MANGLKNSAAILSNMKYQPIRQLGAQQVDIQDAANYKAVSQRNKFTGKQVASEQEKQLQLDRIGTDLAMRKDKLEFNKKITNKKLAMAQEALDIKDDALSTGRLFKGLEFGIGMISTPINFFNRVETKKQNKEYLAQQKRILGLAEKSFAKPLERRLEFSTEDLDQYGSTMGYDKVYVLSEDF